MAKRTKQSAGLLMYRRTGQLCEVFLVHPGGRYWAKKDKGAWTLPKGEYEEGKNLFKQRGASSEKKQGSLPAVHFSNSARCDRKAAKSSRRGPLQATAIQRGL